MKDRCCYVSYAIIRNEKYTLNQLNVIYRHNERKNTNYSNKDIIRENGKNNSKGVKS